MESELDASVQSTVGRAIDEWALRRAHALLARAAAADDAHVKRGFAVEAIVTSPAAVDAARPFAGVQVPASDLVALLTGTPSVAALTLTSGAGLELPKPSADLESASVTSPMRT